MAHGAPDWTTSAPSTSTFVSMDTSELAARLGAVTTEDRRGNVLWFDDFRNGDSKLYHSPDSANQSIYPSVTPGLNGHCCLTIYQSGDASHVVGLYKYLHHIPYGNVGLEIAFTGDYQLEYLTLALRFNDGGGPIGYYVRFQAVGGYKLEVFHVNAWVTVATLGEQLIYNNKFHYFKFTINRFATKYGRMIFNGVEYSLAAYTPSIVVSPGARYTIAEIDTKAVAVTACTVNLSHIVLTTNE